MRFKIKILSLKLIGGYQDSPLITKTALALCKVILCNKATYLSISRVATNCLVACTTD